MYQVEIMKKKAIKKMYKQCSKKKLVKMLTERHWLEQLESMSNKAVGNGQWVLTTNFPDVVSEIHSGDIANDFTSPFRNVVQP